MRKKISNFTRWISKILTNGKSNRKRATKPKIKNAKLNKDRVPYIVNYLKLKGFIK